MTWETATHGWHGLVFAYGLTAVPMWLGMIQRRAGLSLWIRSPIIAGLVGVIAVLLAGALRAFLDAVLQVPTQGFTATTASVALVVIVGYAGGRWLSGLTLRDEHKRGSLVEDGAAAQRLTVRLLRNHELVTLAGVAVPPLDETKHFKLVGTTGTGKSTAIRELLSAAFARGDRAIIADPDAGYLSRFYDRYRGDVILNPFDDRSATWDLFAEIEHPYDTDQVARALIADGDHGSGREWRAYARTFLAAAISHCRTHQLAMADLWHFLAVAAPQELRAVVAGSPAQPFLEEANARMFASVRSVAVSSAQAMQYVAEQRTAPLSVKRWVRSGNGVLFAPYHAGQIATLRTIVSAWFRLAIFETLSRVEGDQRIWFVVDELDALGAIDGLKDALARLRKFGGRCVLGFQSIGQVSSTYGSGDAQTIVENCGNTLILRCSSSENGGTARFVSRLIGEREVVRTTVSRSSRSESWNASTTTSEQHVTELAVLPAEIEQLPDLSGYLKLASSPEWMRVSF